MTWLRVGERVSVLLAISGTPAAVQGDPIGLMIIALAALAAYSFRTAARL